MRVVIDEQGNPWFVAKDVCEVLRIERARDAYQSIKDKNKGAVTIRTLGGHQKMMTVNESGLYSLIFKSRKPSAEAFKDWVTEEVLPSLRKTGTYSMPMNDLPLPDFSKVPETYPQLMSNHRYVVGACEQLQVEKKDMAPKALFYDTYRQARGKHGLQAAAKILGLKPNTFIKELLADGLLFRRDECLTAPESLLKQGFFTTRLFEHPSTRMPCHQTMVTPKGLVELAMRYGRRDDLRSRPGDDC